MKLCSLLAVSFIFDIGRAGPLKTSYYSDDNLTVSTSTGSFTGLLNPTFKNVREFRSIPYAKPPVGRPRFLPPEQLPKSTEHHYSTIFSAVCPQFVSAKQSTTSAFIPEFGIDNGNQNSTSGLIAQLSSEDCLQLAIWTPANVTHTANLPVIMFVTGGGDAVGGISIPYQIPAAWVSRSQAHIAVIINYRVNIMGFPNAAGLRDNNLGILDQRAALEWLQSNIEYFGGDPDAITLWGQSAGAINIDMHTYAWPKTPIARATFSTSGVALYASSTSSDPSHSNFTFVAKSLGCDFPQDSYAELDCMRQVPISLIENMIGQYGDSGAQPSLGFGTVPDEKIVFANYTARAIAGHVARIPAIYSNTANEWGFLIPSLFE